MFTSSLTQAEAPRLFGERKKKRKKNSKKEKRNTVTWFAGHLTHHRIFHALDIEWVHDSWTAYDPLSSIPLLIIQAYWVGWRKCTYRNDTVSSSSNGLDGGQPAAAPVCSGQRRRRQHQVNTKNDVVRCLKRVFKGFCDNLTRNLCLNCSFCGLRSRCHKNSKR